jgi:hypothetical protein
MRPMIGDWVYFIYRSTGTESLSILRAANTHGPDCSVDSDLFFDALEHQVIHIMEVRSAQVPA